MERLKVAVIYGGKSGEHEVSLESAKSIIAHLDKNKYEIIPVLIKKDGSNYKDLVNLKTDVAFPVLHGTNGEDGTIQGLFELLEIPYVGCGVLSSAVGMDKEFMKKMFAYSSLPIAPLLVFYKNEIESDLENCVERIAKDFNYNVFVKPANLGSSVGITKVHNQEELMKALKLAAQYGQKVLVEQAIENAREIEVSVLGNSNPKVSIPGEIIPANEFYDYEAKYESSKTQVIIPAKIAEDLTAKIQKMARQAFKAIDASGLSRVDFFVKRDTNKIYVDEINTMPGFTTQSMYPKLWEASGISYPAVLEELIILALEKHRERQDLKTSRD